MTGNEENLFQQFAHTDWLIRKFHQSKRKLDNPTGTPYFGQGRLLAILHELKQISQKDLLKLMNMRQQSLGELLAKLEKAEYIVRTPAKDRRTMNIAITEKGMKVAPQELNPDEVFGCLNKDEQQILSDYLLRISDFLRGKLGEEADDFSVNERIRRHFNSTSQCGN